MTDIYERLADENEPAPATAPAAQLTGEASDLMASLTVEDSDATTILAALAGPIQAAHAHHEEHRLQAM